MGMSFDIPNILPGLLHMEHQFLGSNLGIEKRDHSLRQWSLIDVLSLPVDL
jgi:hypothetical protein